MYGIFQRLAAASVGIEQIEFQNDGFGARLEILIGEIKNAITEKRYHSDTSMSAGPEVKAFEKAIFDRLGMRVITVVDSIPAAIQPFISNKNHVFLDKMFRGQFTIPDQEKLLRDMDGKKGFVDARRAVIGGVFSEYTHTLYMNFRTLFNSYKCSIPEVTGILLHELGHGFTWTEYSDRFESTNQVLADAAREISKKKDKKDKITYVYKELSKVNSKITEEEVQKMGENPGSIIAGVNWFKAVIGTVETQMSNSKYNQTSSEQLADGFAARFGYGRQVVTGLEKIYGSMIAVPEKSKFWYFIYFLSECSVLWSFFACLSFLLMGTVTGGAVFLAFPIGALKILYTTIVLGLIIRSQGEDTRDYTYDELKMRYKRMRQAVLAELKDQNLPKERQREVIQDITMLDEAIDGTTIYAGPMRLLVNFLFSDARNAKNSIKEQQLIEELTNNDLFFKAAQFSSI